MKQVRTALLGLAFVFALVAFVQAQEAEKTLKGTITCAKCDLKKEDKCTSVIVVKEDGKDVIYYFAKNGKEHKDICKEGKKGTVTGTVEKKGDKHIITVKESKFE